MDEMTIKQKKAVIVGLLDGMGFFCSEQESSTESVLLGITSVDVRVEHALIEKRTSFVEFSHTFVFPLEFQSFISGVFFKISDICYDNGIYFMIDRKGDELHLNLCTKLFFSGLQYYALNEALKDLDTCVREIEVLVSSHD